MEIWKTEPRARFTLRIYRLSSDDPEAFFVVFPLVVESVLPQVSNGGVPFVPYQDQLPGTCRDYFAIDSWVHYAARDGHWIWVSRDAPLITFGGTHVLARTSSPPEDTGRIFAMIYDNLWYTNFVGNSHGIMEFQFDLVWKPKLETGVEPIADSLTEDLVVLINPAALEYPLYQKWLYKP